MNLDPKYFKAFPSYEEVFYDDIENHKKHFLPICSFNLQCIDPSRDEWFHFISIQEVVDGYVGETTHQYHSEYCKEAMYGFDVIDGKYKFEGDWSYFRINNEQPIDDELAFDYFDEKKESFLTEQDFQKWVSSLNLDKKDCVTKNLAKLYKLHTEKSELYQSTKDIYKKYYNYNYDNYKEAFDVHSVYRRGTEAFELIKKYFSKHHKIDFIFGYESDDLETIENEMQKRINDGTFYEPDDMNFYGVIKDIKFNEPYVQQCLKEGESIEQFYEYLEDLHNLPLDRNGDMFEYISQMSTGCFQKDEIEELYLFQNKERNKVVFCTHFT